jgi:hypothetical protein
MVMSLYLDCKLLLHYYHTIVTLLYTIPQLNRRGFLTTATREPNNSLFEKAKTAKMLLGLLGFLRFLALIGLRLVGRVHTRAYTHTHTQIKSHILNHTNTLTHLNLHTYQKQRQ